MSEKNHLLEGSILKSLLSLAVPIVFANLLHTAYQLTDTFWVGRLGQEAVAAVSLSFPIIFLMISLGGGLTIAGTILISQYKGKGDHDHVNYITAQTTLVMIAISIILSTLGYFLAEPIIRLMGAEPAIFSDAVSYLQISFIGLVFLFGFFVFQSLMRGAGEVKTPLIIVALTVLLNLVLDPLFIFGWGPIPAYGVRGAAIATIGTQGLACLIGGLILLSGNYGLRVHLRDLKPDLTLIRTMIRLGLPSSIEQSTRALGFTIMTLLVATFGTTAIAAYGIGVRIFGFVIIPALGLAMATSTLVGQNIGAGQPDRAERIAKKSALIGFCALTIIGILMFLTAEWLVTFFIPGETATIQIGTLFIRIVALTFGFIGLQQVLGGAFMGSGNTLISMILTLVSLWMLQFPLAYILSKHTSLSVTGIWWAFPISNVTAAAITYLYFRKGTWKHTKLTSDEKTKEKVTEETLIEEGPL